MEASEVLRRSRAEHDALRERLASLESLARKVLMDEVRLSGGMCGEVESLLASLRGHWAWEEHALEPLLEGGTRCDLEPEQLTAEHREQEACVANVLEELQLQGRPAQILAGLLTDVCTRLRCDLATEEDALPGTRPDAQAAVRAATRRPISSA